MIKFCSYSNGEFSDFIFAHLLIMQKNLLLSPYI